MADKDDKAKDGKTEPTAPTAADFIMTPELQEELEKAGLMELVEKYRGGEELDALCSRFIKARRGDKKKSFKMLKDYLLWCEKVGHVTAPL